MALSRIQRRTPSAKRLGTFKLANHKLMFNMRSTDGSGKCDALFTDNPSDVVFGALYELKDSEKPILDQAESLGHSYGLKSVEVSGENGEVVTAQMYYGLTTADKLKPYDWYLNHVLIGAAELNLPLEYLKKLKAVKAIKDQNQIRETREFAIHKNILTD